MNETQTMLISDFFLFIVVRRYTDGYLQRLRVNMRLVKFGAAVACAQSVRRDRLFPRVFCARYLSPSVAGFLLQKELDYLQASTSKIGVVV